MTDAREVLIASTLHYLDEIVGRLLVDRQLAALRAAGYAVVPTTFWFCNKCGFFGPEGPTHWLKGDPANGPCNYHAGKGAASESGS